MPLVFDSGGLLDDSPVASSWMLRSSKLRLSAVHTLATQHRLGAYPMIHPRTDFGPQKSSISELNTEPVDSIHPAPDIRLLLPAGFTTGRVVSPYPRKDFIPPG
jgi:hypothetical protein